MGTALGNYMAAVQKAASTQNSRRAAIMRGVDKLPQWEADVYDYNTSARVLVYAVEDLHSGDYNVRIANDLELSRLAARVRRGFEGMLEVRWRQGDRVYRIDRQGMSFEECGMFVNLFRSTFGADVMETWWALYMEDNAECLEALDAAWTVLR